MQKLIFDLFYSQIESVESADLTASTAEQVGITLEERLTMNAQSKQTNFESSTVSIVNAPVERSKSSVNPKQQPIKRSTPQNVNTSDEGVTISVAPERTSYKPCETIHEANEYPPDFITHTGYHPIVNYLWDLK